MPAPGEIEFLSGLHFLRDVDEATLVAIAGSLRRQEFGPGEVIHRQGTFAEALTLIAEGQASVVRSEPEATSVVLPAVHPEPQTSASSDLAELSRSVEPRRTSSVELYRLGKGDTFGELELANEETYHASLTAIGRATVYFWDQGQLEAALQDFPSAIDSLRYIAESRRLALRLQFDWLGEGETIFGLSRKDPNLLIQTLTLPVILGLGGLAMLGWGAGSALGWIGGGLLVLGVGLGVWRWFDWRNDYYIVTNRLVVWLEKVIGLYDSRQESPLHMLLSVSLSSDFAGRTLGYGDVILRTYTGQITFRAVNGPHSMAAIIEEQRRRVQHSREREDRQVVAAALHQRLEAGTVEAPVGGGGEGAGADTETERSKQTIGLDHWSLELRFEQRGVITYRKHWAVLFRFIALPSILVLLLVGALGARLGSMLEIFSFTTDVVGVLILLIPAFGWWVYRFMDWANDLYQITANQILDVYKKPLASELRKVAPLENILGTEVKRKGILGLLLNYGDVIAQVGTAEFTFEGVYDPNRVQQDIVRAQEALVEQRRELDRRQRRDELADWFSVYHEESRQKHGEEASG